MAHTPVRLGDVTQRYIDAHRARAYFEFSLYKAMAHGDGVAAASAFRFAHPRSEALPLVERAGVGAQAADDLQATAALRGAFVDVVRQKEVLGQILADARPVPPHVLIPTATAVATAGWKAEGKPAPAARFTTGRATMTTCSLETYVVFSKELFNRGGAAAVGLAQRDMTTAIVTASNSSLLDANAAVAHERPAGLLYGLTPVNAGSPLIVTEGDIVKTLWGEVAGGVAAAPYFVASPTGAAYLATLRSSGVRVFPDVTATGGSLIGVPMLISPAAGSNLILLDADSLLVADEGVVLDESDQVAVEMLDSSLQQSGITGAGAQLVSAFQAQLVVLRATRLVNWTLGRSDGAAYVTLPV